MQKSSKIQEKYSIKNSMNVYENSYGSAICTFNGKTHKNKKKCCYRAKVWKEVKEMFYIMLYICFFLCMVLYMVNTKK